MKKSTTTLLAAFTLLTAITLLSPNLPTTTAGRPVVSDEYDVVGQVSLENLVETLAFDGEAATFAATSQSKLTGLGGQLGTILPDPDSLGVDNDGNITFTASPGPYPYGDHSPIHIIGAKGGQIHCTWTGIFTIHDVGNDGDFILSGDCDFTVIGGTKKWKNATGSFTTLIISEVIPAGADSATADFTQEGNIKR